MGTDTKVDITAPMKTAEDRAAEIANDPAKVAAIIKENDALKAAQTAPKTAEFRTTEAPSRLPGNGAFGQPEDLDE